MQKEISYEILNNPRLLHHLMENSYYIKYLNRDPGMFKQFKIDMKALYKERTSDKINNAIDSIDMISSVIDTIK